MKPTPPPPAANGPFGDFGRCLGASVLTAFANLAFNGILNNAYVALTDTGRDWATAICTVAFIALAILGRTRPHAFKTKPLALASILCAVAGHGLGAAGLTLASPILVTSGLVLSSLGGVWIAVLWIMALAQIGLRAAFLCIAAASCVSVPLAMLAGSLLNYVAANILDALAQIGALLLVAPLARPFFERLNAMDDPQKIAATHPQAFLPLGSPVFVYIFAFSAVFGYGLRYLGGGEQTTSYVVEFVLALAILGYALHKRTRPRVDPLFLLAFSLALCGFLCVLLNEAQLTTVASSLLLGGYSTFDLLLWLTLVAVVSRTTVDAIPVISWGNAVCYLGIIAGAQLCILTDGSSTHPLGARVAVAVIAAALAIYTAVARRSFSFDTTIAGIDPATASPEIQIAYIDPLEAALATVSEQAALTPREREMAGLLAHGHNARHIQEALSISGNTVKYHARNVYAKLGVHNQQELIERLESAASQPCKSGSPGEAAENTPNE